MECSLSSRSRPHGLKEVYTYWAHGRWRHRLHDTKVRRGMNEPSANIGEWLLHAYAINVFSHAALDVYFAQVLAHNTKAR